MEILNDNENFSIINRSEVSEEDDLYLINEEALKNSADNPFKELDRAISLINEENKK